MLLVDGSHDTILKNRADNDTPVVRPEDAIYEVNGQCSETENEHPETTVAESRISGKKISVVLSQPIKTAK